MDVSVVACRSQRHQIHPGASVTGGHQPENVGNGTWVLSTSSAHSEPLSHLSRSHKCWILNKNFHNNPNNDSEMHAISYLSAAALCVTQMVLTGASKSHDVPFPLCFYLVSSSLAVVFVFMVLLRSLCFPPTELWRIGKCISSKTHEAFSCHQALLCLPFKQVSHS